MILRSKKEVLDSITERKVKSKKGVEYVSYSIYLGTDGKGNKIRRSKPSLKEAQDFVRDFFRDEASKAASLSLSVEEVYDAKSALKLLRDGGMEMSLSDAARLIVEGAGKGADASNQGKKLSEAYEEYYASFPEIQYEHKKSIRNRVGAFVSYVGGNSTVSSVTAPMVAGYLSSRKFKSEKTWNNNMTYIKAFLYWCAKKERGYVAENPVADMEKKKIAYRQPEFAKVDDVERLFGLAEEKDARILPFMVLSYFCGVRSEEIIRLSGSPQDISLDGGTVKIAMPKGWQHGIRPRMVQIPDNAMAWMRRYGMDKGIAGLSVERAREAVYDLANANGIHLPHNAGRHSFITYHVAAYGDPAKTEAMAGTSSQMRASFYMGLTTMAEGKRYFSIMPGR